MAERDARLGRAPVRVWDGRRARRRAHRLGARASARESRRASTGGVYLNFIGDEGEERVRAAFGPTYERLAEIKRAYDPDNVFPGNQNVRLAHAMR